MLLDRIVRALEAPLAVREPFRPLDAIVVLGGPLGPGDRMTPSLYERVHAAAELYRAGGAPRIIASGGITRGASRAEADAIADELAGMGIPASAITVERHSKSTFANARFTAQLVEPRASVWLVTQPFHGRRAQRLFRRAGIDAHVWHIDDSLQYRDRRRALRWVLGEYASWAAMYARRY